MSGLQFASDQPGSRFMDHSYTPCYSGVSCGSLVMRGGGGDQCGRPFREHWTPYVWHGKRHHDADPEGQDFDFDPVYDPEPTHNPINQVLTAMRDCAEPDAPPDELMVEHWVMALEAYEAFRGYVTWEDPSHPYHAILVASPNEREHAFRVLNRVITVIYEGKLL